ncbi:TetR/AcrR family transcriptional regulator [Deinococcus sp. UYEF24]
MPRVSKAQAVQHRQKAIQAAAELFRERGFDHVSVQNIMAAVGLTHGGFYRQFDSKDALFSEATSYAYAGMTASLAEVEAFSSDHREAQRSFIREYLSLTHRDEPGSGCPTTSLIQDVARSVDLRVRQTLAGGVVEMADWIDGTDQEGLVAVCTMIGALLVARATKGTALSETVLDRVADSLLASR